jgi:hypothetical protein
MFPLEYPLGLISKYRKDAPVILDPFCGRGTTLYAARRLGFKAYGLDTSPIAAAIAQAKLASATVEDVMALAEELVATKAKDIPDAPFFRTGFSKSTLAELCSLRDGLLKARLSDEAAILRAAALGCLHGPLAKDSGTPSYFSNQMPRTFSSKPDYSVRFWKQHDIKAPEASVLAVLRKKLSRIGDIDGPSEGRLANVKCKDARMAASYRNVDTASLTITSPPYYGMRTYVEDQWLRNWFIGGPAEIDYRNEQQLRHTGHDIFVSDLAKVWKNVHKASKDGAHLYIRFGAIPSVKSDPRELLKASLKEAGSWDLVSVRNAKTAESGKRQAVQMGRESAPAAEFDFHAIRA